MIEVVLTTKQEYQNTKIHFLNNMYRNGWSAIDEEDLMIFVR